MEFHENKARKPFSGFVMIWQMYKAWRIQSQTRRILKRMSDERLKDIGLRRDQIE